MKKVLYIFFVLWVFSLLQAPPAAAWNVKTHYDIAEQTYYSLPDICAAQFEFGHNGGRSG